MAITETEEKIGKQVNIFKKRFEDAMWFDWLQNKDIILLGAGAIGSWTSLCLGRIGCKIHVFDMDTIESHNMAGQLYFTSQVGMNKAQATASTGYTLGVSSGNYIVYGKYTEESFTSEIVISALDNMATRKLAFDKWVEYVETLDDKSNCLFIDGRLMAESYQVYAVTPENIHKYRDTLFDDSELEEALCTLKSTTHCSMGVAKEITSLLTNFAANKEFGVDVRELPFSIVHEIVNYKYEIT